MRLQSHAQAPAPRSREERTENVKSCAEECLDPVFLAADGCAALMSLIKTGELAGPGLVLLRFLRTANP